MLVYSRFFLQEIKEKTLKLIHMRRLQVITFGLQEITLIVVFE